MECFASNAIPIITSIIGNNGIKTVNGIIRIENKPAKMPSGRINITVMIIENRRKIIFIGILKIYKPVENNLNKITNPNTIKRTENISIVYPLSIMSFRTKREIYFM